MINTNRLLRQYLHKNADLRSFTKDDLDAIAAKLTTVHAGCWTGPPRPKCSTTSCPSRWCLRLPSRCGAGLRS
jgi:hypothetical protein